MHDGIIEGRAELVLEHARVIQSRIKGIKGFEYFTSSDEGLMLYDSLIIRLQAIGENCKKIHKKAPTVFDTFIPNKIKDIIRFRDLASHHYELLDYQIIYQICIEDIPFIIKGFEEFLASRNQ